MNQIRNNPMKNVTCQRVFEILFLNVPLNLNFVSFLVRKY